MPANFPEIWERRVINNLTNEDVAPWLEGIPELDANVIELGAGTATEKNIIHIPTSDFDVDILINNTTYPLALQEYTDDEVIIALDKYQTKVVTLSDDQVMGASYDKIDNATRRITHGLTSNKYQKAIHSIAPSTHTDDTPIISKSGDGGTLTYNDIVNLKDAFDGIKGVSMDDRRLVLTTSDWNSLLKDRERFASAFIDYKNGKVLQIADFSIFQYLGMPSVDSGGAKKAFGEAAAAGDKTMSVAFCKSKIAKKTGLTKQYFVASKDNPRNQSNELAYRHYFIVTPYQPKFVGALI